MNSVVILTADGLRHRYFANTVAQALEVRGVVSEQAYDWTKAAASHNEQVLRRHFAQRDAGEERFFSEHREFALPAAPVMKIPKGALNYPESVSWIAARNPDYVILFGCSIVRTPILEKFPDRCINMHLGLSPYYRGSATNFWPLVNREPELVGATIHLATAVLDGGPILRQCRPDVEADDRCHEIGCRAIIEGTNALIDALDQFTAGRVTPKIVSGSGRLYRRKDFDSAAVIEMWRHFDSGMISEYLSDSSRIERYPIIA